MVLKKISILIILFCGISLSVFSQKTTIYTNKDVIYQSGLALFEKEKYAAAQEKFTTVLKNIDDDKSEIAVNAMYYRAICGLKLFNIDAEALLTAFIFTYPESPKVKLIYFYLGEYKFRKHKYKEALAWFAKIDIYDLSNDEIAEYQFKKGYSYFMEKKYSEASKAFFEIKDTDNKYTSAARYYYAHIAYLQKKYESSLLTFQSLNKKSKFASLAPYYITQIYYLQKKYDKLIAYAPALLDVAIPKRAPEIARLIGEAYYRTGQFKKAIPYLIRFNKEKAYLSNRTDKYELGYAYYKSKNCEKAVNWFKKSITKNDSLSQIAYYNLAECYLKLGEKKYARSAFRIASKLNYDAAIKEDALFSFAKISYELSYQPFNDAIKAFEEFINTYPKSKKLNNAYDFLVTVYYTTKNYKAALNSLENIKVLNLKLQEAYQKIAYYRAISLFNDHNYKAAIVNFNKSDKYPLNNAIFVDNSYWRAASFYRLGNYTTAINAFKKFVFNPFSISSINFNKANYSLGYTYFRLKEYENAKNWFRKYIQNDKKTVAKIKEDVLNRIADCFFINKEYKAAIEYYNKASKLNLYQVDYSLYQSAVANGVVGNYTNKATLLDSLIARKQKSHLLDDAIFELGKTQLVLNKNTAALSNFNLLINKYPNSPYISKSLVKEGLIYYNNKEDDKALISFKKVVADYPKTMQAKESLMQIKKIYIAKGALNTYENYLASIGGADSSAMVLDADYYEVAENSYMSGNCNKAVNDLSKYLEKYPNGNYVVNANYYKATCEYKSKYYNEALIGFNYVINKPKNKFTENALLQAAIINQKLGNKTAALNNYSKLEYLADVQENVFKAQVAQMRLNFELKNYDEAIKYCRLIINKDINDNHLITEAHLIYGKSTMAQDDYNLALTEFTTAATSANRFGAEAKYNVAYILNLRGEYDKCETEIFSLIKKFPSYDYWMGKALILLSDNYVANENIFQAKATLKSIIDNSKYPALVTTATEKLQIIEKEEEEAKKVAAKEEDSINLDLNDNAALDKLFLEDEKVIDEQLPPTIKDTVKMKNGHDK